MPPETVTASLRLNVIVTALPTPRSPPEGDITSDVTVGTVGIDLQCAAGIGQRSSGQIGGIAGTVGNRRRRWR